MECNILRIERNLQRCTFVMEGDSEWKVFGKTVISAFERGALSVYKNDSLEYTLKQTSLLKPLLAFIPLSAFLYCSPFYLYCNGVKHGYTKKLPSFWQGRYQFYFDDQFYELTYHSRSVYSLMKNGTQIAIYRRYGNGNYKVRYSKEFSTRPDLLILFAAFVEVNCLAGTSMERHSDSYRILNDHFFERSQWTPSD